MAVLVTRLRLQDCADVDAVEATNSALFLSRLAVARASDEAVLCRDDSNPSSTGIFDTGSSPAGGPGLAAKTPSQPPPAAVSSAQTSESTVEAADAEVSSPYNSTRSASPSALPLHRARPRPHQLRSNRAVVQLLALAATRAQRVRSGAASKSPVECGE
ncbi:hypothetical protein B0A49_09004 [Cryomyces minteri]|uniref:Uncharacterized protein n=1 Tax=Cryomyces minteri TaxID=331657 RepID=A0A4U0XJZ0_9PEZI|nr:hypothetical protein B0A49_09004 [Cryomyces minteri]